jgi:hypothetical protein
MQPPVWGNVESARQLAGRDTRLGSDESLSRLSYQQDSYPDSLAVYTPDIVGFVYPGMHDDLHYSWRTTATLTRGADFDHFLVQFNPDTIAYHDTSQIVVTAVDYGNQEVNLNATTQLMFTLDSARFGSFINPTGQVVSSPLSGVNYSDARDGKVKFIDNGDSDTVSLKAVSLKVDGAQKTGRDTIYIGNVKLTFVDKNPRRIWPYIDEPDKGANRPGYNPKRSFAIQVRHPSGRSMKNQTLKVLTSFIPGSGGHLHTTSQDTVIHPASFQGKFWSQNSSGNPLGGLLIDSTGNVIIDSLQASPFSGSFIVTACLTSDTTVFDSVLLNVKVDSLVDFGTGSYWTLTGSTSDTGRNHPSNHWCTQKVKDSLQAGLHDFYDWPGLPGLTEHQSP